MFKELKEVEIRFLLKSIKEKNSLNVIPSISK